MSIQRVCGLLLGAALIGGCAETPAYYYAPESPTVTRSGVATHVEKIPPEAPQGTVDISSVGIAKLQNGDRALHVRLAVDNEGDDTPWTVDIREQLVEIPNVGRSAPLSARADLQTLPTITIGRREKRTVDLYYPLPPAVRDAGDLSGFDLLWQVKTAQRPISGRTRINRFEAEESYSSSMVVYGGWGPYWWYDPWYPRVIYRPVFVSHGYGHRHGPVFHDHRR
ncbi:MAG TPA: hypothetical protein VLB44_07385 [Kofleriaceae bacterium]|nr:hypothetical protein [Kofleriaceae bacterium]